MKSLEIENVAESPCSEEISETKNVAEDPCLQEVSDKTFESKSNISSEQDSEMTSNQSQVHGDFQTLLQNKEKIPEKENSEVKTKEDRGQTPSDRVNQIGVIKLTGNPNNSTLQGKIGEVDVTLLLDTGATVTCLNYSVWKKLNNCKSSIGFTVITKGATF